MINLFKNKLIIINLTQKVKYEGQFSRILSPNER